MSPEWIKQIFEKARKELGLPPESPVQEKKTVRDADDGLWERSKKRFSLELEPDSFQLWSKEDEREHKKRMREHEQWLQNWDRECSQQKRDDLRQSLSLHHETQDEYCARKGISKGQRDKYNKRRGRFR